MLAHKWKSHSVNMWKTTKCHRFPFREAIPEEATLGLALSPTYCCSWTQLPRCWRGSWLQPYFSSVPSPADTSCMLLRDVTLSSKRSCPRTLWVCSAGEVRSWIWKAPPFLSHSPSIAGWSPSEETWTGNFSTDSLDLAWQVLVSHLMWVPRSKPSLYEDGF